MTLSRRFVNNAASSELFWVNLAGKYSAMLLAIRTWVFFWKLDRLLCSDAVDLRHEWYVLRVKRADEYTSEEFKSNMLITQSSIRMIYHSILITQDNILPVLTRSSIPNTQEQYMNISEQRALWLLYKISSRAACSFGVWTTEIAHQPHYGLILSLPSGHLSNDENKWQNEQKK